MKTIFSTRERLAPRRPNPLAVSALAGVLMSLTPAVHAGTIYWDGPNGAKAEDAASWNTLADGTGSDVGISISNTGVFSITPDNSQTDTLHVLVDQSGISFGGVVVDRAGTVRIRNNNINGVRNMNLASDGITINSTNTGGLQFGENDVRRSININLTGSQTWTNNSTGGVLRLFGGDSGTNEPNLQLNGHILTIDGSANTNISRKVFGSGTGDALIKNGTGTLTLSSNQNNFTGTTRVNAGTLNVNAENALGGSVLDTDGAGTVGTNATALTFGGLAGGTDLGTGNYFSTGYSSITALTLNSDTDDTSTYTGDIADGAAGMTLTISGAGTQVLNGAVTNTGGVTVNGGRLDLGGTSNTADIVVNSGAAVGGEGSTTGALTFNAGSELRVDATTAEEFAAGNLDISGGVILNWDNAPTAPGAIDLLSYTGTLTTNGNVGGDVTIDFDLTNIAVSSRPGSGIVTDNAGIIQADLGYANRTWNNNAANGLWDIGTSANWVEGDNLFYEGDFVTFGDTGAGTVTLNGADVNPITATFSNTTANGYTIASTAAEAFQASGGIFLDSSGDVTIDSVIQGITAINHNGTGTLTLNGTNTFTGGVTVASGATLATAANNGSALGGAGSVLNVQSGGQWNAFGGDFSALGTGGVNLAGTGTGGAGALVNSTNTLTLNEVNLTDSASISSDADLAINGISTSGTGYALSISNPGFTTTLNGNNSTTAADLGQVINNAGNVVLNNNNALGGAELVMNNGVLSLAGGTYTNDFELNSAAAAVNGPNGNITFASGTTLTMTQGARIGGSGLNDNIHFEGIITGSGDITLGRSGGAGNQIGATADLTTYTGDFRLARTGPNNLTDLFINDGRILSQDLVIVEGGDEQRIIGAISGSVEFAGDIDLQENNDGSFQIRANTGKPSRFPATCSIRTATTAAWTSSAQGGASSSPAPTPTPGATNVTAGLPDHHQCRRHPGQWRRHDRERGCRLRIRSGGPLGRRDRHHRLQRGLGSRLGPRVHGGVGHAGRGGRPERFRRQHHRAQGGRNAGPLRRHRPGRCHLRQTGGRHHHRSSCRDPDCHRQHHDRPRIESRAKW
jgi:fibronectin-binding autotransporter adhesin